jgi:hypothetical protein
MREREEIVAQLENIVTESEPAPVPCEPGDDSTMAAPPENHRRENNPVAQIGSSVAQQPWVVPVSVLAVVKASAPGFTQNESVDQD